MFSYDDGLQVVSATHDTPTAKSFAAYPSKVPLRLMIDVLLLEIDLLIDVHHADVLTLMLLSRVAIRPSASVRTISLNALPKRAMVPTQSFKLQLLRACHHLRQNGAGYLVSARRKSQAVYKKPLMLLLLNALRRLRCLRANTRLLRSLLQATRTRWMSGWARPICTQRSCRRTHRWGMGRSSCSAKRKQTERYSAARSRQNRQWPCQVPASLCCCLTPCECNYNPGTNDHVQ